MYETKIIEQNGHIVEFVPIVKPCTYHSQQFNGACRNCNNTMKYVDGYNMIIDKKWGFIVDSIK